MALEVAHYLEKHGASFLDDIARGTGLLKVKVEEGLWQLVAHAQDPFAVERRLDEYLQQHDLPSELSDEVGCRRLSLLCAVRKIRRVEDLS